MKDYLRRLGFACVAMVLAAVASPALAADPVKIGFSMSLTGGLAGGGKSALLAIQMWAEDVNAKGGLLGRPVQLVFYDDQTNSAQVPAIYTKLLDVDKVDFVISAYATNQIAPAMPIVMQRNLVFMALFGTGVNDNFNYPRYFQILPNGPDTKLGLKLVYDKSYPPNTVDFAPVVRAIQAANPDVVFVASYPPDSVGMVRAANEIGLKPKMFGGGMIGLAFTPIKLQLGHLLNGIVAYDVYVPEPTMKFPGVEEFLKRYQERAQKEGVDPLGYYLPPFAYSEMQVLAEAVTRVGSLDQGKIADYIHKTTFHTIVGDVTFAPNGEWAKSRVLFVQYRDI